MRDVSFEVRAGEIVGLAGVDANGQSELIEVLTGLRKPTAGTVTRLRPRRHGRDARARSRTPASATSPRTATGAASCSTSSLAENIFLREYRRPENSRFGLLSPRRIAERARGLLKDYDVRGGGVDTLRRVAVGRQPAEVRDRARADRPTPTC